jgi:hypothetical protein
MAEATLHPAETPAARPWYRPRPWIWAVLLLGLLVIYYLGGMLWLHAIDAIPTSACSSPRRGSQAVAIAADLIDREINVHRWVANDPFFLPGSLLDNMPEFQQGIVAAISRFALELTDQVGRTRGTSQADADLDRAAGLLRYPGTIWIFDLRTSMAPTASSEQQYRQAVAALRSYNDRLAQDQAVFETRADNLLGTLDRIAADIGSSSAALDHQISGWLRPDSPRTTCSMPPRAALRLPLMRALGSTSPTSSVSGSSTPGADRGSFAGGGLTALGRRERRADAQFCRAIWHHKVLPAARAQLETQHPAQ